VIRGEAAGRTEFEATTRAAERDAYGCSAVLAGRHKGGLSLKIYIIGEMGGLPEILGGEVIEVAIIRYADTDRGV